jgi:sugar lactone lactonase YvrE
MTRTLLTTSAAFATCAALGYAMASSAARSTTAHAAQASSAQGSGRGAAVRPPEPPSAMANPYRIVENWPRFGDIRSGAAIGIIPDGRGGTWLHHRSEPPILHIDATGAIDKRFGDKMFVQAHGFCQDRDGNFWAGDSGPFQDTPGTAGRGFQVFKFSPDGKVLMTLGKAGVSGSGRELFDQPTDVVVAPNGDVFVTDSHRNGKNNRVVRFTKTGAFVREWGTKGSGRGAISEPHTIAMDSRGRLFVGDRENNRIQIFEQDGRWVAEWRQFGRPSGISITADDTIYVTDSESGPDTGAHELPNIKKGIRIGSARTGVVTAFIEDMESTVADHSGAEGVGVDAQGNVYGAVVRRRMLERHVKR